MTNNQFLDLLYSDLSSYITILSCILVLYYFVFGRKILHIADPLMVGFIAQAFSCSVVFFIYYEGKINDFYFFSFVFTEIFFLLPLALMRKRYIVCPKVLEVDVSPQCKWNDAYSIFYSATIFIFIITTTIYFSLAGIPILNQMSRLDTNESLGIISWFTDVYWICLPALIIIKRFVFLRRNFFDYLIILLCFIFLLAKGGKSDFFFMIISIFLVKEIFQITELKRFIKWVSYASPFVILCLMVIIFSVWNSNQNVLNAFFERFVLFGDVFYQGYDKGFMLFLPDNIYPWDYFFGGTINKIRALFGLPIKEKVIFGYEISKYYYNIDSGIGPNARHNILGLYLFGPYLSLAFSFSLGLIYCFLRSGAGFVNKTTSRYSLKMFFYLMLLTYSFFFFVDPSLVLGLYLKILFVFSIPLLLVIIKVGFKSYLIKISHEI